MTKHRIFFGFVLFVSQMGFAQTPKADSQAGKTKFAQLCSTCHGNLGKGDGPAAAGLNPKPADLSQTKRSDAQLAKIIKLGGKANGLSPLMPVWGTTLSDQEIANILAYIRMLKKS